MASSLRRAGIAVALSLVAVAGCLLPDLGALQGGDGSDAAVNDAPTVDAPDTGATDAKSDASSKRFCETYDGGTDATVCEDMDSPAALAFGWVRSDGGSLSDGAAVSAPNSLDVVHQSSATCSFNQTKWIAATPNKSGVHIELDVNMISTRPGGILAYWIAITWSKLGAECGAIIGSQTANAGVNASGDFLRLQYLGSDAGTPDLASGPGALWANGDPPPSTAFRHLVFDYDVEGKSPPVFTLDGKPSVVVFQDAGAGLSCSGMKLARVSLGASCVNNADFHFRYDNVVITPK